jgi:hypothetical protein
MLVLFVDFENLGNVSIIAEWRHTHVYSAADRGLKYTNWSDEN